MSQGSMTYVAQEAWVQNATLRDNVLFGKPMNTAVYDKIIDACALRPDIEDFPGYDLTEIGEKVCNTFYILLVILISLHYVHSWL